MGSLGPRPKQQRQCCKYQQRHRASVATECEQPASSGTTRAQQPCQCPYSNVNALDANHQRGGPSTPNVITGADPGPGHIPQNLASRLYQPGQREKSPEVQDAKGSPKTSNESAPSPDVAPNTPTVTNAMPGTRDKTHKVPAPSTAPNVPAQQGKPLSSDAQESAPRNVQSGHQSDGGTSNKQDGDTVHYAAGCADRRAAEAFGHSENPSQQSNNFPQLRHN